MDYEGTIRERGGQGGGKRGAFCYLSGQHEMTLQLEALLRDELEKPFQLAGSLREHRPLGAAVVLLLLERLLQMQMQFPINWAISLSPPHMAVQRWHLAGRVVLFLLELSREIAELVLKPTNLPFPFRQPGLKALHFHFLFSPSPRCCRVLLDVVVVVHQGRPASWKQLVGRWDDGQLLGLLQEIKDPINLHINRAHCAMRTFTHHSLFLPVRTDRHRPYGSMHNKIGTEKDFFF